MDILLQHADGTMGVWFFNGLSRTGFALLNPPHPGDPRLRVVSVLDRNRDGKPDLLLQNSADGMLGVWFLDGVRLVSAHWLNNGVPLGPSWQVVGP
jgi:hypothetical protein